MSEQMLRPMLSLIFYKMTSLTPKGLRKYNMVIFSVE